jgi:hypothetical protein
MSPAVTDDEYDRALAPLTGGAGRRIPFEVQALWTITTVDAAESTAPENWIKRRKDRKQRIIPKLGLCPLSMSILFIIWHFHATNTVCIPELLLKVSSFFYARPPTTHYQILQ